MKKTLATLMALAMILALAACGGKSEPSAGNEKDSAGNTPAPAETYTFSIGMNSVEGDVPYYLAEFFKQAMEEKGGSAVEVNLYPGGQMGGDAELTENVMAGSLDFYCGNISNTVPYVTAGAVLDEHWGFDDLAHFRRFIDSDFMDELNNQYKKSNIRIAAVCEVGMRHLLSNKKIEALEDMAGLKVRVMQNKYHIAAWEALGAAPTPMDWGEVYVGLQQKMIDCVEQPYFFICSSKLYEVQDYMLETNHIAQPAALFMSEKVYQGLPAEIQALIDDCSEIATQKTRETTDSMMADRLQEIKDHGVEVSQVTPELLAEMRERVAPATELIKQDVGEEFFNAYAAARDAAR